jgi:hypothetical protein
VQPRVGAPYAGIPAEMVRLIGLAVAVAACWACAPAQADVLPVQLPTATVPAAVKAVSSVSPAVGQIATSAPAGPTSADDTVRNATAAAKPAVKAAVATTTLQVARGRAGDSGDLRVGASSLRRVSTARLRHAAASREPSAPVRATQAPRSADRSPVLLRHAQAAATSHPPTARPERGGPLHTQPASGADGGVSAGAAGLFAGGLAMLAGALMLVAPRLHRRLLIDPAVPRPVAFVALLERPG